jgi:hypothetical protein
VTALTAEQLGYATLTDAIRERMKTVITKAIRDGVLGYQGKWVYRVEQE